MKETYGTCFLVLGVCIVTVLVTSIKNSRTSLNAITDKGIACEYTYI